MSNMNKAIMAHEEALAVAYSRGAEAYVMRNFDNPYQKRMTFSKTSFSEADDIISWNLALVLEWEAGYNHARAIALALRRANANKE